MKRHFLVFYLGIIEKGFQKGQTTGYSEFATTNGEYLNKKITIEQLLKTKEDIIDLVITNIIELSKSDYDSWIL